MGALVAPTSSAAQPSGAIPLRVATYNIHAGAGMDEVFDLDRQTAALRSLRADIIGLQEVDVHWSDRSEWRDLAGELARRLHMHVYFAPIYDLDPVTDGESRREYGVAVLSRHPIRSARNHEITRLSTQDADPVPAPAPGFPEVVVEVRGKPVHVYTTHLDYRPDPEVRETQVADMRRIMGRNCRPGPGHAHCAPRILLGDFNAEPTAPELSDLWRELRDAGPRDGADGLTFPAQDPVSRIDYVTASRRDFAVRGVTVPETLASDHRPVVADLVLRR
ncbi:endonuclease/exonuclease/phosphatase family protein [Streptomyces sp. TP-A0874]|uniref:endonuclease/exonuclease/phosphatase family protein n=1 Tax=Streptomyces sp. TP-A0874 TaxID=549819 RepID=UPI001FCCDCD9|nr:endonuclease/exonuclease/phosphatase family protein [Streptomyces sp. TP-A0874]